MAQIKNKETNKKQAANKLSAYDYLSEEAKQMIEDQSKYNKRKQDKNKKAINSKKKGKTGELEVANILKNEYGLNARRGQQFSGSPDSPDVICEEMSDINIEVKRSQTLNIEKAMQQSTEDAGNNKTPIVVHRKNNEKWKVTMWLNDYMELKGFKKVKE